MTPTQRLRFVERRVYVNKPARNAYGQEGTVSELVKKTILQQWWEDEDRLFDVVTKAIKGEWRDVPVEKEDAS